DWSRTCTRPLHVRRSGGADREGTAALEELQGGEVAEGLVGADGVIDLLPPSELGVERRHRPGTVRDFVELFGMGPLGAFDMAIEPRALGGQDEELNPEPLTLSLEAGVKLTPRHRPEWPGWGTAFGGGRWRESARRSGRSRAEGPRGHPSARSHRGR